MIKFLPNSFYSGRDKSGKQHWIAQLVVDNSEELSGVTEIDEGILDFGSTALSADGKFCLLDSKNTWHDMADGSAI